MNVPGSSEARHTRPGFDLSRTIRRFVLLSFALIQMMLVARILLDLGVIPGGGSLGDLIVRTSDTLSTPVQGVADALPPMLGSALTGFIGNGFNMAMVTALAGWTVVEALVMRVVKKFDAI